MNILITGGSSGLGQAVVEQCATNEYDNIYFTYHSHEGVALDLEKKYASVKALYLDFCSLDSVSDFVSTIESLNIDVLVNNAWVGTPQGTHFYKTPYEDFQNSFENNILPTIRITQACLNIMKKKKFGKIINVITSSVIDTPPTGYAVYAANKAYLRQLSKSVSSEYAKFNITSNCVLPDNMQTPFGKLETFQLEMMLKKHPLKRLLTVNETAEAILFLVRGSQQINGAEIILNAGQHIL